jgi:hypothetical protein
MKYFKFQPTVNFRPTANVGFLLPSSILKPTNWILLGVVIVAFSVLTRSKTKLNHHEQSISKTQK